MSNSDSHQRSHGGQARGVEVVVDGAHQAGHKIQPMNVSEVPLVSKPKVRFLFWSIDHFSPTLQITILSLGVFVFFIANGFVEEYVFSVLKDPENPDKKFEYGWYLTFYELLCFAGFAALERTVIFGEHAAAHKAKLPYHFGVAVVMTASRGLTNVSLQFLNYPTQVIFKSAKLLTVMFGGVIMLGKKYDALDYVSSCLLVGSAIYFSLGDKDATPEFDNTGIIVVSLSLVADSLHSNTQEIILKKYKATVSETLVWTNIFASGLTLIYVWASGELAPALAYCNRQPIAYALFVFRAMFIYLGVMCFIVLIKSFDVVLATTVTTVRKILTVLLSFLMFPKTFTPKHFLGALMFIGGLYVSIYKKRREKKSSPV